VVKDMVKSWVGWFKQHRRILTADLIHIRRPDGQSIDGIVHVDASAASGEPIAMAAFFNPTNERMNATINLPLYYAGVAPGDVVNVTRAEPAGARLAIYSAAAPSSQAGTMLTANARSRVALNVVVPGGGYAMFTVQRQRY
jgi:hypothetical protein